MFNLTKEMLARYVGGRLEVKNETESFEGKIKEICLIRRHIEIYLSGMNKDKQYPSWSASWINDTTLVVKVSFENYAVLFESVQKYDCLHMRSTWFGDVILYPSPYYRIKHFMHSLFIKLF